MAKIIKRTKKDGTCSYCIRVSNGYDRQGRQVLVNRTFTPLPGLTGKKLEKELQRQADAFEQEVHSGISLDASMKLDDLIEKWFTEYADRQLKPKTATEYRKLVPRVSAALGHMKVNQIRPAHLMAFYANLSEGGVRQDSTYTATAALLKLLPKGQRARIREAAGVGEETMRGLCSGKPVSHKTAEKVADAAGLPLSKAFTEKVRAGGKLGGNTQLQPLPAHRSPKSGRNRSGSLTGRGRCKAVGSPAGRASTVQRYHTACLAHRCPPGRDMRLALVGH